MMSGPSLLVDPQQPPAVVPVFKQKREREGTEKKSFKFNIHTLRAAKMPNAPLCSPVLCSCFIRAFSLEMMLMRL